MAEQKELQQYIMAEQSLNLPQNLQHLQEVEKQFPAYEGYSGTRLRSLRKPPRHPGIIDVNDPPLFQVQDRNRLYIEDRCVDFKRELLEATLDYGYESLVPCRHHPEENIRYSTILKRHLLSDFDGLSRLLISRNRMISMMIFSFSYIRELCRSNVNCSIREFYYQGRLALGWTEEQANGCIADMCCLLQCTRDSLLTPDDVDEGKIAGPLTYLYSGIPQNCMSPDGLNIPRHTELVRFFHTNALFILLVGKHTVFHRLLHNNFHHRHPCIIITGGGQIHDKRFVRNLHMWTGLPVFGFFDGDIGGVLALTTYATGSISMIYDSGNLATPDIKWLGIRNCDIKGIPDHALRHLTDADFAMARGWKERDCFDKFRGWDEEVAAMIKLGKSVSIECLDFHPTGFNYLFQYLDKKLENFSHWI